MSAIVRAWLRPRGVVLDVLPAIFYLAVLFWFGLTPLKELPGPDFALADKVWHAAAFGALASLLARLAPYVGPSRLSAPALGAWAAALGGGALELLQSLTRYRSADWADFVADALGAAVVYGFLRLFGDSEET